MISAAILLSRQPLQPSGSTPWVCKTHEAVRYLKKRNCLLLTSTGMQTWELIAALGALEECPVRVYVAGDKNGRFPTKPDVVAQFGLSERTCDLVRLNDGADQSTKESILQHRDRRIVSDADIVVPISIRSRGRMSWLVEKARDSGREIVEDFRCSYVDREEPLAYAISADEVSPELRTLGETYIIHWTRASGSRWPGERLIDYYSDILKSDRYPRLAIDTLARILRDRLIIASDRHMPGNIPTVSFSALSPYEIAPLMRWRARYSQMSFEPYGVGVKKEIAAGLGIKPVIYVDRTSGTELPDIEKWRKQSIGAITDWRKEREYRHLGDLRLNGIPGDDLIAVCRTSVEARQIEKRFGLTTVSFCRD